MTRRTSFLIVALITLAFAIAPGWAGAATRPARPPATTTTTVAVDPLVVYQQCRVNGPGRQAATAHLWTFKTDWSQAAADAIVADVGLFVTVCRNSPYHADDVIRTGKIARDCLLEWSGYLPTQGACYNPPGNEINPYTAALLVSSQ